MDSTVDALKSLYVAKGGQLTDHYEDISNGEAVGNLITIPDLIHAIARVENGGGGSGGIVTIKVNVDNIEPPLTDLGDITFDDISSLNAHEIIALCDLDIIVRAYVTLTCTNNETFKLIFYSMRYDKHSQVDYVIYSLYAVQGSEDIESCELWISDTGEMMLRGKLN